MPFVLATIVEGHGDVPAVRLLLQRLHPDILVPTPIRVPKSRIKDDEHLRRYIDVAHANINEQGDRGAILLLFDADSECAVALADSRRDALKDDDRAHFECILVVREFEAWLIAGDPSHQFNDDPETHANPKRVLQDWYGRYKETADQPRLTSRLDIDATRTRCRSFRAFESALQRLLSDENIG